MPKFRSIRPENEERQNHVFLEKEKNFKSQAMLERPVARKRVHKKTRRTRINPNRFLLLCFIVFLLIAVPTGWKIYGQHKKIKELEEANKKQEEMKKNLENEVAKLENQLKIVNTDEFIERYAHEKFGMVKPNEIIYEQSSQVDEKSKEQASKEDNEGSSSLEESIEESDPLEEESVKE